MDVAKLQARMNAISASLNPKALNPNEKTSPNTQGDKIAILKNVEEIKQNSTNLKNINENFGALRIANNSLQKLADLKLDLKELLSLSYKEQNLFENLPFESGVFNAKEFLHGAKNEQEALKDLQEKVQTELDKLKDILLGKTKAMGELAQKSIDNSGLSLDLSSVSKASNIEYLKQQIKSLLA